MKLTQDRQQLLALNYSAIMGKSGQADDFQERLDTMASMVWSDFFEEEVAFILERDQLAILGYLFSKEDVTEKEFMDFFHNTIPDFDEQFRDFMLESKEETVKGRITQLGILIDDKEVKNAELLKEKLTEAKSMADAGEWLKVQDIINSNFADFE